MRILTLALLLVVASAGQAWTPDQHTHAGSDVTSGTVAAARLESGTRDGTKFLRDDNTWAAPSTSGYRTKVTLAGDVTDSSGANTYTDLTGFSFPVTSGVRTNFYALIWYTSAATTTGSGWSINGPATTNMAYSVSWSLTASTQSFATLTAYNTPAASNASSLTAGNVAVIQGTILPSASGTVIVRFMSEVDTSAIVAKAGSTLEYWNP